jgi:peptidoglycan LD-endopeptidase CwlK
MTGLTRRSVVAGAAAVLALPVRASAGDLGEGLRRLQAAYPTFIATVDARELRWRDGTAMPVSLYPTARAVAEQIRAPDLAAQVMARYPKGRSAIPNDPEADPGRVRYTPFFAHMYGGTREAVARNIVRVRWPTRRAGGFIEVTRANGVDQALAKVAGELALLPRSFAKYFDAPAGGFVWRPIAGTNRLSGHAFGIAVDINTALSDYWRDSLARGEDEARWRQTRAIVSRIPYAIIEAFERNGFIWGGKWYHYDTMHFEYRPELLGR